MYIQPEGRGFERPVNIPEDYSGNAFTPSKEPVIEEVPEAKEEPPREPESAEAFARHDEHHDHREERGFLSRFPFLSSLLPPKRKGTKGGLPDWVLIAAVVMLFFSEDDENDILPFLLLLLLWD